MRYTHFTIGSPFDSFNNDVELAISNEGEVHQSGGNFCGQIEVTTVTCCSFIIDLWSVILKEPDVRVTFYHDIYFDTKSVDFSFSLGSLELMFYDNPPKNFHIKIEWDKRKESKDGKS